MTRKVPEATIILHEKESIIMLSYCENYMARTGSLAHGIAIRQLVMGYAMYEVFQGAYTG